MEFRIFHEIFIWSYALPRFLPGCQSVVTLVTYRFYCIYKEAEGGAAADDCGEQGLMGAIPCRSYSQKDLTRAL
jgi:hypothetical protein